MTSSIAMAAELLAITAALADSERALADRERRIWRVAAAQCAARSVALLEALPEQRRFPAEVVELRNPALSTRAALRVYFALRKEPALAVPLRELVVLCTYATAGDGDAFAQTLADAAEQPLGDLKSQIFRACKGLSECFDAALPADDALPTDDPSPAPSAEAPVKKASKRRPKKKAQQEPGTSPVVCLVDDAGDREEAAPGKVLTAEEVACLTCNAEPNWHALVIFDGACYIGKAAAHHTTAQP